MVEFVFASAEESGDDAAGGEVAFLVGDEFAATHGGSLEAEDVTAPHQPPFALVTRFADDAAGFELEWFGVKGTTVQEDLVVSKNAVRALNELGVFRRRDRHHDSFMTHSRHPLQGPSLSAV